MPIMGDIKNLYSDKNQSRALFPTTKIKAVSDDDGKGLNAVLDDMTAHTRKVGNPYNLLDNSDFRNPVNQRGGSTHTASGVAKYTIDRWDMNVNVESVTCVSNGVQVTAKTEANGFFRTFLEHSVLLGKTYTFAVKTSDGELVICSGTYPASIPSSELIMAQAGSNDSKINIYFSAQPSRGSCQIRVNNGSTVIIEWAALYEGEYTAETLPEYQPKGYAAEYDECTRYFYRLKAYWKYAFTGMCTSATNAEITIPIPQRMRIEPTMTISDTSLVKIKCGNTGVQAPSADAYSKFMFASGNAICLGVKVSGATAGSAAIMYFDNGGTIDFSADL